MLFQNVDTDARLQCLDENDQYVGLGTAKSISYQCNTTSDHKSERRA